MTKQNESDIEPPQAVSRWGLYLPVGLLLAVTLGWSGFWIYASWIAQRELADWQRNEAKAGRIWTCDGQEFGGYPFRIELRCASVSLSAELDGKPARLKLGSLNAVTQIYNPTLVLADLGAPLAFESDNAFATLDWSELRTSVRLNGSLQRLSIAAKKPSLSFREERIGIFEGGAQAGELHLRKDSERPTSDLAMDFALRLVDARIPAADRLIGNANLATIDLSGAGTQITGLALHNWRNMLEAWRTSSGTVILDRIKLSKGDLQVDGTGLLSLDSAHRLQGQMNLAARGLGPIISRLTGNNMNQIVSALLEKKDGTAVQWPVRLQDGRISIGPVRSPAILAPLY